MQLGGTVDSRRFVFTAGTFSILDILIKIPMPQTFAVNL
jgi:hypothetical protein